MISSLVHLGIELGMTNFVACENLGPSKALQLGGNLSKTLNNIGKGARGHGETKDDLGAMILRIMIIAIIK